MNKFEERETKRKKSLIKTMIGENEEVNVLGEINQEELEVENKEKEEIKTKRLNIVVKPTVYEAAKKKCKSSKISMNECINQLLEIWSKK